MPLRLARPVGQQQLRQLLAQPELAALNAPEVYGRSARTDRWTFALASPDADSVCTALALSWKLYDGRAQVPHAYSAATLPGCQRAVAALAPQLAVQLGPPALPVV